MLIWDGFSGAIGNTPLLRLGKLSAETGCEILGKAEFPNPGGSVKDRAALYIIHDAERRALLAAEGTAVEGTAGNTGIGLAHLCATRGYRCIIVIPDNQSPEKMELLRVLGAEVRTVPPKPYADPDNYQKIACRLAASLPNAIWANQFDNVAAAVEVARQLGPGHTVVTLLCDHGGLYLKRLFNPEWLNEKGLTPDEQSVVGEA